MTTLLETDVASLRNLLDLGDGGQLPAEVIAEAEKRQKLYHKLSSGAMPAGMLIEAVLAARDYHPSPIPIPMAAMTLVRETAPVLVGPESRPEKPKRKGYFGSELYKQRQALKAAAKAAA